MTYPKGLIFLSMIACVAGLTCLLYMLNIGRLSPIASTLFLDQAELCDAPDCTSRRPISLPYFSAMHPGGENVRSDLILSVPWSGDDTAMQALYLPKLSDTLTLHLNGALLRSTFPGERLWNTPQFIPISPDYLRAGINELRLSLTSPASEGVDLQPAYFGPAQALYSTYNIRWFFSPGLAQFGISVMAVLSLSLLFVWSMRRSERAFLWLSLSCLCGCVFLFHYGLSHQIQNYKLWTGTWVLSVSVYVFLILKFIGEFIKVSHRQLELVHLGIILAGIAATIIAPVEHTFFIVFGVSVLTGFVAFSVLTMIWALRARLDRIDFVIFFCCLSSSVALGFYDFFMTVLNRPDRTMHLFHLTPLVMSLTCIWLILSQLIRSMRAFETLTAQQSEIIQENARELKASFHRITQIEQEQAVTRERERIMADLHDGIGGQLVSTLAYVNDRGLADETLRTALETTLRELALLVDSMSNDDSLVTLLGMLRTRLEELLARNGVSFDWQIIDEPDLSALTGAPGLEISRIVQEAITNVIKHARASRIRVYADKTTVRVSDNGQGFDLKKTQPGSAGFGLHGMAQRAARIGADYAITSGPEGTCITLTLGAPD